jgi:hypothetical protein
MSRLALLAVLAVVPLGLRADDPPRPPSAARVVNPDDARRKLGLLPNYPNLPHLKFVKVAVLDSGFEGFDGKRPYLPADTVIVEHYDPDAVRRWGLGDPDYRKPFAPGNPHGRLMAQLVWATAGGAPDGPHFYLLNANGPTLFRRAVRFAVEAKVDVILFSGSFEGAGNYDGRGPINAAVDDAVAAGILWVNAAGNYGGSVYNGGVEVGPGGDVRLGPAAHTGLRFRNRLDENAVTVTLTWNDYRDAEDAGTDKDLDLVVEDAQGRAVGRSELRQLGKGLVAGEGQTKNPRERLTLTDLAAGEYRIRVKARTLNFGPRDRLRVLLTSARTAPLLDPDTGRPLVPVEFLDATRGGEIYPPADHPGVITVGDASPASSVGPTADGRVKPDVIVADSVARFSNGEETAGASNAAAYFAGVAAVMRAAEPGLGAGHVREWVRTLDRTGRAERGVRNAQAKAEPLPPVVPRAEFRLPQPPVALPSPNQQRALRYSAYALEEKRRQGDPNPEVLMSTPGGTYVVKPGGRPVGGPPPAPVAPPSPPPEPVARAAPPAVEPPRRDTVHAPWQTPPPQVLAALVRGGR